MQLNNIAQYYNETFGFNILPLVNKVPAGDWIKWQKNIMTPDDISSFKWKNINGIGAVQGINKLRCFDFDNVSDFSIVQQFLWKLGLPAEYRWTVVSGSGKGYHIWFYCDDDSYIFRILGGEKSYYKFKLLSFSKGEDARGLNIAPCDHIELRWKNCQTVLPPSLHPSGNKYKFRFLSGENIPETLPNTVPSNRLIDTLNEFCLEKNPAPSVSSSPAEKHGSRRVNYDELNEITEHLSGNVNNYQDWMRIGFALASLGEEGREHFIQISRNNPAYNDTEESLNRKFDKLIKDYNGSITLGTLYEIAKQNGYIKPLTRFWSFDDKDKARIFSNLLIAFLEAEGFSKMFNQKDYMFIRDKDNVISEVTTVNIKDHIMDYINNNTYGFKRSLVLEHFIRNVNKLCSENTLECLKSTKPDFVSDTKDVVHFFFRNCFIELTKDGIKQRDYSEMKGKIWERQKTEHDFYLVEGRTEFQDFIENICKKDQGRISALRSAIGYLLVSYKDPSCSKAIIFSDEKLSENAYGRSGKGLVAQAISQMKNVLQIDGKNFSFDKNFMFQSVEPDTQIIIFDDVKKKFSFDKLFSILTDGMTVEKKNKSEFRMPHGRSPKILITTNHTVEGTDDSSLDRQFVIEFSDYYNARHKPKDDFGHLLFDDWNGEQWSAFYLYMAECCMFYLNHGLKSYKYVNLTQKKLIDSTAPEFEEFIKNIPLNTDINKKELFDQFKKEYEDFGQIKQNTLSKWTKLYCDLYNLELSERKSGTERYIMFISKS